MFHCVRKAATKLVKMAQRVIECIALFNSDLQDLINVVLAGKQMIVTKETDGDFLL